MYTPLPHYVGSHIPFLFDYVEVLPGRNILVTKCLEKSSWYVTHAGMFPGTENPAFILMFSNATVYTNIHLHIYPGDMA